MKYFSKFYSKVNQIVCSSLPVYSSRFKALALIVFADNIASIFLKDHNSGKGQNSVEKKYVFAIFFMRNLYKKFQNSSMHGSKVMLCIKKGDERTDGQTNASEAICPSNFFEVGGITKYKL